MPKKRMAESLMCAAAASVLVVSMCFPLSGAPNANSPTSATVVRSRVVPDSGMDVTMALQAEMAALSDRGGGRLVLAPGRYEVGDLALQNGVELNLPCGTVLAGVDGGVYPTYETYPLNSPEKRGHAVVRADGVVGASLTGEGTVDGNGGSARREKPKADENAPYPDSKILFDGRYGLLFNACRNVRIEGITVRGASFWTCFLRDCDGVLMRNVDIFAHANLNNDGIDISSRNVLIEDCRVDAEDDAIVFKSFQPDIFVTNVVVRNCRLSSNASAIKVGTETFGRFRDIRVENCVCDCRASSVHVAPNDFPGEKKGSRNHSISGMEVSVVDGGTLDGVVFRDIVLERGIGTPLFIRLGRRRPSRIPGGSFLRNVLVENVRMTHPAANAIACSISGVPGLRPSGITLRNCDFLFPGARCDALGPVVPEGEFETGFPWPYVFNRALPAYGLYVRHADSIRLEDTRFRLKPGATDFRPDVVKEDCK